MDNLWSTACTTVMPYFLSDDLPEEAFQVSDIYLKDGDDGTDS
jgi:hypothetical protein